MAPLTDSVVIVTGGSTGVGRELAGALARQGYTVVVVYLDDQRGADAAVDEILGANGTAIAVRADVTDELDVHRLFSETAAVFGGVDVVVHADSRPTRVVNQQAASRLRPWGAVVDVGSPVAESTFLVDELRARGITIAGLPPGPETRCSGSGITSFDIAYWVAVLDRWRLSRPD